jgi:hypothetical protein
MLNVQWPQELISRAEAKARGLTQYFTGKPCGRGHVSARSVSGQCCLECKRTIYAADPKNKEQKRLDYWKHGGKEKRRALNLKAQYGLTVDQYNKMALAQDFRCAICDDRADLATARLVVDHDHKTKKVRGLLCYTCNLGLGAFNDQPFKLKQAILYLKKHGG